MSQSAPHPDYAVIVDHLDLVGQKYRVQRLARGTLLFVALTLPLALIAGWLASYAGAGAVTRTTGGALMVAGGVAFVGWVLRPMLFRPRADKVARLIETRVPGLHDGLTNALRLHAADDLRDNPWTSLILTEIRQGADGVALASAVTAGQLRLVALRSAGVVIVTVGLAVFFWQPAVHGWKQLFAPTVFVPQSGLAELIEVVPGNVTLVRGQALEISVIARAKPDTLATIILNDQPPQQLTGQATSEATNDLVRQTYSYRLDHVDDATRYRIEIAGTQSPWYDVAVIDQVRLEQLALTVTPPPYTGQKSQTIDLTPGKTAETAVTIVQGSKLDWAVRTDHAITGASLQLGEAAPLALAGTARQFAGSCELAEDTTAAVLLQDSAGRIIARLPEPALALRVTPDAAPRIEMRWPTQDAVVAPDAPVTIKALLRDDYGLTRIRVLYAPNADASLEPVLDLPVTAGASVYELTHDLAIKPEFRLHDRVVRFQLEATDNRAIKKPGATHSTDLLGSQVTLSPVFEIKFQDARKIAQDKTEQADKLRAALRELLEAQQGLQTKTLPLATPQPDAQPSQSLCTEITAGQTALRDRMTQVATTYHFETTDEIIQKTLLVLAKNPAQDAIEFATALPTEPAAAERAKLVTELQTRQRRIILTLEQLLAVLKAANEPTTQPSSKGGDLPNRADVADKLKATLDEYMKEQRRILDQTAPLVKKPVDNFDDADKAKLAELQLAQEKLDAFMQEKVVDFSKLAEQDMANAALLKELMEVYSEVTMAKDALKKQAAEIAVSHEESGLELAKEITTNLEKWLMNEPDRDKWTMEDPLAKTDTPMAELPTELEDMIGELMEQQEDILDEAEDAAANWADSADKGAGWDAADGPIANMSAKGVTGNRLPNNNEMNGRSGEGRSGKSSGEMVEENATGKGGRNTPTRLDPTAFQQGQINDTSKDPVGGATGGGKLSGQGGEGLEGPVAPGNQQQMKRLAEKQAQLRNAAEKLNLKLRLGRYDNFQLLQSIAMMRRIEADLQSNRYQNAMRRKDVLLDHLDTSRLLLAGEVHVQQDTTPATSTKTAEGIRDAMKGDLPPAWSDALKEYYKKLGQP